MMNPPRLPPVVIAFALLLGCVGCKKAEAPAADASQLLQQSFATAAPEVKQGIDTVNTNLKAGNYAKVTEALMPIVSRQQLTEEQKRAVSTALLQINQAIAADPKLDSKEMYELRAKMFEAVRKGSRF
jgi:hypothetical protein